MLRIFNRFNNKVLLITLMLFSTVCGSAVEINTHIQSGADDVEERASGRISSHSSDLEMVYDSGDQTIGLRFVNLDIPQGAKISSAYLQFTVDETDSQVTNLNIYGELSGNALAFSKKRGNVTSRAKTSASTLWSVPSWEKKKVSTLAQRTPELKEIVQEIVNLNSWKKSNSMVFIVNGTGKRVADSYEGGVDRATKLHIEFTVGDKSDGDKNDTTPISNNKLSILIPLYVYPDEGAWQEVIDAKNNYPEVEIVAIVNPSNGHFDSSDGGYENSIPLLIDAGVKVVGYVYTNYGDRRDTEIKADIDKWQEFYQDLGVSGIFFDEASTDDSALEYYKDLTNYSELKGFNSTILNPGITTDSAYIEENVADIIVSFEDGYDGWKNNFKSGSVGKNSANENTKLALMVHSASSSEKMEEIISTLKEDGFEYVYVTPDADSDPWDSVATYFDGELQEILNDDSTEDKTTSGTIVRQIQNKKDDVEQQPTSGKMSLHSSDLELVHEGEDQLIGLRFRNIDVPKGAIINSAYVQFNVKQLVGKRDTNLNISAEDIGDSPLFKSKKFNLSNRTKTFEVVEWHVPEWNVVDEEGDKQKTPNLKDVVQSVINRNDWKKDNSLSLIITGTGKRTATSYDLNPEKAPTLYITYGYEDGEDINGEDNSSNEEDNSTVTAPTDSSKLGMLVPLYIYPDLEKSDSEWQRVIDNKKANPKAEIIVIANPSSGHFSKEDTPYIKAIKKVVEANITVVGYVYTKYGERDIELVKTDIDNWTAFYKDLGVTGIFFDEAEGREDKEKRPYYAELTKYIKSKDYAISILNPGITADQTFVDNYTADIIVSFESSYTAYKRDFKSGDVGKTVESEATATALMIHDIDSLSHLKEVIADTPEDGFDYLYVTSGDKGWADLGENFEEHVTEMLKYDRD